MKTISVSAQFIAALHTFNIARVRETLTYRTMCEAAGADMTEAVDEVIQAMFKHCQEKREVNPRGWKAITEMTQMLADEERTIHAGEPVTVTDETTMAMSLIQRPEGDNPRIDKCCETLDT